MPKHSHYVEPFFGGGSVLLAKSPEEVSEVVNDLHMELTTFWRVLQNERQFQDFTRIIEAMPFSQVEWRDSRLPSDNPIQRAVNFFVRCRQSRAGKLSSFATLSRNRTRRGMNEQVSSWMSAVQGLPAVAERLKRVVILNDNAVDVIRSQDGPNTLFYLDPPYVHHTRSTTSDYDHEMNEEDHARLLDTIKQCTGKIMISGYPNKLYDSTLKNWGFIDINIDNKASSAKEKPIMTERIWMNYKRKRP